MTPETSAVPAAPVVAAPPVTSTATPPSSSSALTSDFETFLQMLTAQARYQDPLEPIDSSEYSAQLAQFSMVEQQVQTNDTLAALFTQLGTQNVAALSAWVGMDARAVTPMRFDGQPITISPKPGKLADQAVLVVKNSAGTEVQRLPIPLSDDPVVWAGIESAGTPFPAGTYSFEVESHANGTLLTTEPAAIYARVTEAQIEGNAVMLILEGGVSVPSTSVTALRAPS